MADLTPLTLLEPGRLEIRTDGRQSVKLSMLVIGFGLIELGGLFIPSSTHTPWTWSLTLAGSLIMILSGLINIFTQSWILLDRNTGSLTNTWRLLKFTSTTERSLSDFQSVRLYHRSRFHSYYYYCELQEPTTRHVLVYVSKSYAKTRLRAVYLAEFLGLPLVDAV